MERVTRRAVMWLARRRLALKRSYDCNGVAFLNPHLGNDSFTSVYGLAPFTESGRRRKHNIFTVLRSMSFKSSNSHSTLFKYMSGHTSGLHAELAHLPRAILRYPVTSKTLDLLNHGTAI
jgi:hypothetical protein